MNEINMPPKRMLPILFLATFVVHALIVFAKGAPVSAITLGQSIGASLLAVAVGYIIALIPASIYRAAKGCWPTWTGWVAVPFILFMLFAVAVVS